MKRCLKHFWILAFLAVSFPSPAQPKIVDGFDYPFGNKGIENEVFIKYHEKYIYGGASLTNMLYPHNPCYYPRRESDETTKFNGWYSLQDVGTFYENHGGLHSGEDWNLASLDINGNLYNDDSGAPIFSIANGIILKTGLVSRKKNFGSYLIIKHEFAGLHEGIIYSIYAHIDIDKSIKKGTYIKKGQLLGKLSHINGPHLHFEIRTDIKFKENEYFWQNSAENGWYYTDNTHLKRYTPLSKEQTMLAFNNMQKDGILDPTDFIDSHRWSKSVGYYSENEWRNDGISLAFLNCFNRNGGIDSVGHPVDSDDGFIKEYDFTDHTTSLQRLTYFQYFKKDSAENFTIICYNPLHKKAFHLKGCIGFLWWEETSDGQRYQNYLGLPVSDETTSDDAEFEVMQNFEYGTIYWRKYCTDGKDNVKIAFKNLQNNNDCVECLPATGLSVCDCDATLNPKSASLLPDCNSLFSAQYLQKTSWNFGREETAGWTSRNATDQGYHEDWYWMIDPAQDPDPVSGSGIVSPPFLNSIHTSLFDRIEIRAACKSQFMETLQLHVLINGQWQYPLQLECISPEEEQLPNNQCVYRGFILHPGQIQQFRIDFIEGSDETDDRVFIDYIKFLEGANPVPSLKANLTSDIQWGQMPLMVSFSDSSAVKDVSPEVQYEWDFGDGSVSDEKNPVHLYAAPGEYTVRLKISSGIYSDSITKFSFIRVFESSPVVGMEYFLDTDPGPGKGIPVLATPGEDFTQSFFLNSQDLTEGYHKLYVRAKDAAGRWGAPASTDFYAGNNNYPYPVLMESYVDGTNDRSGQNDSQAEDFYASEVEQNFYFDFSQLTEGYHTLYIRYKDNYGNWGNYSRTPFYRITGLNQASMVQLEHFIDNDPGVGQATGIALSPCFFIEQEVQSDLSEITTGQHVFGARVKNSYGIWSETYLHDFSLVTTSGTNIEYLTRELIIYPNPTSGKVKIDLPGKAEIWVYDFLGRKIYQKEYVQPGIAEIDLSGNAAGIYLVQLVTGNFQKTQKIQIQK